MTLTRRTPMRRTPMRRTAQRDPVSPALRLAIFARDGGCIAPRLGGTAADCWGRLQIEHVKRELRASKRAESIAACLVTLCDGHTEPGRRAGRQWNTAKVNRARVREYLRTVEDPENPHLAHVDPCGPTCYAAVRARRT